MCNSLSIHPLNPICSFKYLCSERSAYGWHPIDQAHPVMNVASSDRNLPKSFLTSGLYVLPISEFSDFVSLFHIFPLL